MFAPARMETLLRDTKLWRISQKINLNNNGGHLWLLFPQETLPGSSVAFVPSTSFHSLVKSHQTQKPLLTYDESNPNFYRIPHPNRRSVSQGLFIFRVLKGALKVRYLLLGGAIGSGYSLNKTYQKWTDALPDLSWMDQYFPQVEDWETIRSTLLSIKDKLYELDVGSQLRNTADVKFLQMRDWLETRLEAARLAAEKDEDIIRKDDSVSNAVTNATTVNAFSFSKLDENSADDQRAEERERTRKINEEEIWKIEMKYQKEVERLERENKELRQQILLRNSSGQTAKKIKVSLIDMYSDVLDELIDYDAGYKTQDHLPRVVVIGDQSSGKTSVLEMIAQARIFPRGSGEMMTRAPVKVTLSEGPYHIAQFKDSSREFDLTKETNLADLRREVELRMRNVCVGKTVSHDVISMTVKGPGLPRMVLVDLPGIISTNTLSMAQDTREAIHEIAKNYMSNPNAIILCIQDGSVDAERSNVTDLVAQMDPQGKRTIFVLTKIDLAEENFANPERIGKILAGELFPMKALGYFAVITGRGATNESIQQIKEYEEKFFRTSKLFSGKVIRSSQITTRNLSLAVSECFWKMVRETIEQQADAFKAQRFNLETEWKNKFPRQRILDRNELFEKARGEILDEVINLTEVNVKQWEDSLATNLWSKVADFVFENIYLSAAQSRLNGDFSTQVDIQLSQWAEQLLPQVSVEAGWETLQSEFRKLIEKNKTRKDHDDVFDDLKTAVLGEVLRRHKWEEKASDVLRVLQMNTLADQVITDKQQWDTAVRFLESSIKQKLQATEKDLKDMLGPSTVEQWTRWRSVSEEQRRRNAIKGELEKILYNDPDHTGALSDDELTTVRNTLQRSSIICSKELIMSTWDPLYRKNFLKKILEKVPYYAKGFFLYRQGIDVQEYNEVVLYWRIQQMLRVTVNSLRQQIMNREALRIDEEMKDVLEEFGRDKTMKEKLLTGRRVTLAEELKRVKRIQEKLEEFINALNLEKRENGLLQ